MAMTLNANDPTANKVLAQKWLTHLNEYSDWTLAHKVLRASGRGKGPTEIAKEAFGAALVGGGAGFALGSFGGAVPAAVGAAGYKLVAGVKPFQVAKGIKLLGDAFQASDKRISSAIEAGLYGLPTQLHAVSSSKHDYQSIASKLAAARNDPETAFVNMHAALTQAGVPDDEAHAVALTHHSGVQFLASKMPRRMSGIGVATNSQPDPVQQRRLVGQVRTMQDPTYGIAYPTKTNMQVLQKFYPYTLFNAQQAALSQLQRNPNLPARSKMWASRLLGRPMNNLSSPTFSTMISQARAQAAQSEQQAQQSRKRPGGGAQTEDAGPATRLDRLQGAS